MSALKLKIVVASISICFVFSSLITVSSTLKFVFLLLFCVHLSCQPVKPLSELAPLQGHTAYPRGALRQTTDSTSMNERGPEERRAHPLHQQSRRCSGTASCPCRLSLPLAGRRPWPPLREQTQRRGHSSPQHAEPTRHCTNADARCQHTGRPKCRAISRHLRPRQGPHGLVKS